MTRINSAIPVRCLTDEHLLAEHREIKRMPYCLGRSIASGSIRRIPRNFTLGRGHVLFFIDKMGFLHRRYKELHEECARRGFHVTDYEENWSKVVGTEYYGSYIPTEEEKRLLTDRITQRILGSSKRAWHYHGKPITKEEATRLLI